MLPKVYSTGYSEVTEGALGKSLESDGEAMVEYIKYMDCIIEKW